MDESDIMSLCNQALLLALKLSTPLLLVTLGVGIVISLFQAVFQVQDQTLSMVPKLIAGGAVLALTGGWMLRQAVEFTGDLWTRIPEFVS
jgi:flagellar biosynthetic protein FliQ